MGYLPKGSSSEVVIEAVKQVLAGKRYLTSELASTLIGDALDPGKELPHQTLSEREFEVLRLYGKGCTPSQIAHRLGLSIKTISTHRTRILAKLQLETTGEMVRYAVQQKLV
jgi:DNA-binding NarL/FixJ family response regulator